ncbi:arylamine N-acetyltransferase, pineal gland isozyme NAT-3-like [Amphiura filiformis]|uniref:arylamine N-acetyltransferase, pineal gland isozyme NAT-3-like n=1 Tax=Amphiura filiformis TaxID=82378 RepID=UPI003B219A06
MTMLSETEALWFLKYILKVTSVQEKLINDKIALLDEIINIYRQKIPFQSITVISRTDKDQHLSTMDDIKAQMLSTHGGMCYDNNVFMKHLLEVLGFEVCLNACDIKMNNVHDHVSVLVKNLVKTGDNYYVDVGTTDPFFQAISLDFDKESPVYRCGFQVYKFVKEGEEISWWQKVNTQYSPAPQNEKGIIIDGWKKFMTFTLEPREIEYFRDHMIKHYVTQNPPMPGVTFLQLMRAVAYPGQKLLAILGTSLLHENDEGKIEKTKIRSKEELEGLYAKYFPQLPGDLVTIAIEKMKYNLQVKSNL